MRIELDGEPDFDKKKKETDSKEYAAPSANI